MYGMKIVDAYTVKRNPFEMNIGILKSSHGLPFSSRSKVELWDLSRKLDFGSMLCMNTDPMLYHQTF